MWQKGLLIVVLLGLFSTSSPSDGVVQLVNKPYSDEEMGFAVHYPEGWWCGPNEDWGIPLVCGEKTFRGNPPIMVYFMPGSVPAAATTDEGAEDKALPELFGAGAEVEVRQVLVGDQSIGIVSWMDEFGGSSGYVAHIIGPADRAVLVLAMFNKRGFSAEAFALFGPTFDAMVSSMTFFEPEED